MRSLRTLANFEQSNTARAIAGKLGQDLQVSVSVLQLMRLALGAPYRVIYYGNGSDGGTPPVDSNSYNAGDPVNVADLATIIKTASMTKTGAVLAYWNTKADGSGDFHGWPQDTSFTMPAADVELYAQWFVTTGLANNKKTNEEGVTDHYKFAYDSTLQSSGLEPGRTNTVIQNVETDYPIMANWFNGVTPSGPLPIPVFVTRLGLGGGSANNTGPIRLNPGTNDPNELRSSLVSEVTESFMSGQGKGWGFLPGVNNEESCGEALSLFLTQQFALGQRFPNPYSGFTAATAKVWLNSSLPVANIASTRFFSDSPTPKGFDYGSRADYVNSVVPWPGNGPGTGCSILFIYYLLHQLGFTLETIIAAVPGLTDGRLNATAPLQGVYRNLTNDKSDPFPNFKQLLDTTFPPDKVSAIPGSNPDDPFPLPTTRSLSLNRYLTAHPLLGGESLKDRIGSKNIGNLRAVLNSDRPASLLVPSG
jgi:hypothetical protein